MRAPLLCAVMLLACNKTQANEPQTLKVAAASDLAFAFKDVGAAFEKQTGTKVLFEFGSTGLLEKQIAEGAPYEVFAAANVSYVDDAVKAGACAADTKTLYARGRVVLFTPPDAKVKPTGIADLVDEKYAKIAIANPEHAPYGKAAKQALEKAGVWDKVQPRVVYGENIQQTLQYAQSGNVAVAIVALSLATVTPGDYALIDESMHAPIDQGLAVCGAKKDDKESAARKFTAFVASGEGHAIMKRYGFLLPGDSVTELKKP